MKQLDSLLGGMPEGANFGEMLLEGFGLDGMFSNLTPEQIQQAQDAAKKQMRFFPKVFKLWYNTYSYGLLWIFGLSL